MQAYNTQTSVHRCGSPRILLAGDDAYDGKYAAYEEVGKNESENTQQDSENSYTTVAALTSVFYVSTARHYASAVYVVALCPSVCLSVSVCHVGSHKENHTIAQGL